MAEIKIKELDSDTEEMAFDVEVVDGGSSTSHRVTLDREYYEALTEGRVVPPRLVEVSLYSSLRESLRNLY